MTPQEMKETLDRLIEQTKEDRLRAEQEAIKAREDRILRQEGMKKIEQDLGMRWDHAEEVIYRGIKNNLKTRWIDIYEVHKNIKTMNAEFDVVAINGKQVIVVEVKNKLKKDHLDYFEKNRLAVFKEEFPKYKDYELLGGVWWLIISDHIEAMAEKRGLFVFRQNGDHVEIVNSPDFKAKVF